MFEPQVWGASTNDIPQNLRVEKTTGKQALWAVSILSLGERNSSSTFSIHTMFICSLTVCLICQPITEKCETMYSTAVTAVTTWEMCNG